MSFSSRRRNYMLTSHRRDGLIEWMKSMLMHSFVLDALDSTAADTFSNVEMLIDEYRDLCRVGAEQRSRLKILVPTVGTFHTPLQLARAFHAYNSKYGLTTRRHICISFNELRHILNLAQIMSLSDLVPDEIKSLMLSSLSENSESEMTSASAAYGSTTTTSNGPFKGPSLITFDGDQTLYSDGANFESNPVLANYMYLLLTQGVSLALVTAAGYEYQSEKYELRLSGLLQYFKKKGLRPEDCDRFYLMGGECNYLLKLGSDYHLHAVKEWGPGGWLQATRHKSETPGNWKEEDTQKLLTVAEEIMQESVSDQKLHARVIRKKRSVGLIPDSESSIPQEALDETVLRVQERLRNEDTTIPWCAFNGGRDCWADVGNKSVGVTVLQTYLGLAPQNTLHIGDQFLHTGNDFAARNVCPCIWITSPEETKYILKQILRLAGVVIAAEPYEQMDSLVLDMEPDEDNTEKLRQSFKVNFKETARRSMVMDVYTGEMIKNALNLKK